MVICDTLNYGICRLANNFATNIIIKQQYELL